MPPRILIRADASPAMGTGHVMRCLALAQALTARGVGVRVASVDLSPALAGRLAAQGVALAPLPSPAPDRLSNTLEPGLDVLIGAPDVIGAVIDGYHFSAAYRAAFKAALGARPVLALDDGAGSGIDLAADLILNPGGAVDAPGYAAANPTAHLLAGPAYALLRAEFRHARATPLPPLEARRDILLTFGGTDPGNLTLPCLKGLARALPADARLRVAVGGTNPRRSCIEAAAAHWASVLGPGADGGPRVVAHVESPDMAGLMRGSGLALSAAGGTLGELACMAVPTVLVIIADNQEASAKAAAVDGRVVLVDARGGDGADTLVAHALALWADPARRQALAGRIGGDVDALGAERAADALLRAALPY